jgi:hypothetical protein
MGHHWGFLYTFAIVVSPGNIFRKNVVRVSVQLDPSGSVLISQLLFRLFSFVRNPGDIKTLGTS